MCVLWQFQKASRECVLTRLQGIADLALRWQEVKRSDPPVAHPSKSAPDSFQGNPPPNAPIIQGNCNPPDDPDSFKGNPSPNAPIVQDNCNPALDDPDSFQGNPSPNASPYKVLRYIL